MDILTYTGRSNFIMKESAQQNKDMTNTGVTCTTKVLLDCTDVEDIPDTDTLAMSNEYSARECTVKVAKV